MWESNSKRANTYTYSFIPFTTHMWQIFADTKTVESYTVAAGTIGAAIRNCCFYVNRIEEENRLKKA